MSAIKLIQKHQQSTAQWGGDLPALIIEWMDCKKVTFFIGAWKRKCQVKLKTREVDIF